MPVGLQCVDDHLLRVERAFTRPRGLSERPWFNNLVYAPSDSNLYAAELLPGVLGAMRGGSEGVLAVELDDLATPIRAATVELVAASVSLRAAGDSRVAAILRTDRQLRAISALRLVDDAHCISFLAEP